MKREGLRFTELNVRRMYGEAHDGLHARELCGGLNIIYGPNAAGKTTLGRAVQCVLWPDRGDGQSVVEALFRLNGTRWRVDLQAGRARFERDGRPADRPVLPLSDHSGRYHLYLHELLAASEEASKPFARAILQEAAGGIDVAEAQNVLGFKAVRPASGKLTREAEDAWVKVKEARTDQDTLRDDQRRLERLRAELEEARAARSRGDFLERAIAFRKARESAREKRSILQGFPAVLKEMTGEESDRLRTLREGLAGAEGDAEEAQGRKNDRESRINNSIIETQGLDVGFVAGLEARVRQLDKCEQEAHRIEKELRTAETERDDAWKRIQGAVDEEQARGLDVTEIGDLSEFVREAEKLRAEEKVLRQQEDHYKAGEEDLSSDLETCREASRILTRWLQAGTSESTPPSVKRLLFVAAIVLAAAALVLGINWHWLGFVLLIPVGMVGWVLWRLSVAEAGADERARLGTEYERSGGRRPDKWEPEVVRRSLDALFDELAQHSDRAFRQGKLSEVRRALAALEGRKESMDEQRDRMAAHIGIRADLEEESLYYLVEMMKRWQELDRKVRGCEAELAVQKQHAVEVLDKINGELRPFGFDEAEDAARAHQHVTTLSAAADDLKNDLQALCQAVKDLEKSKKEGARYRSEIHALFERLQLDADDEVGLHRLCGRLEEFRRIQQEEIEAGGRENGALERLKEHPLYDDDVLEASAETLQSEQDAAQATADGLDDLSDEIKGIEARVRLAEREHTLEERRARHVRALEELRRKREEDFRSVAGRYLAEYIRTRTQDEQLPKVFHRAREVFGEITRQRYRLDFDEATEEFAAYDNVLQRGRSLDQLSSGTRVQLLLSVRLAFLEQQEQGVMIPLVLDETLANSDDGKAEEIISAVLSICRTGRQVFYFTAQEDEVRRWKAVLDKQNGVEHRILPLGDAPAPETTDTDALPAAIWQDDHPDPDGRLHTEYGRLLKVPGWDFRSPVGSLHVWYLITDVEKLHRVLSSGFTRWGSLEKLGASEGLDGVGLSREDYRKLALCARALETWREGWTIGRGSPVDRTVLLASDAVSEKFIDSVSDLCDSLEGRGMALIQALRRGEVSGFWSSKTDNLERYLLDHGYIESVNPRADDEIWATVVADLSASAGELAVDLDLVQEFLARVAAPN